ncbi:MAG TPA: hypothetical protein PLA94_20905, partial [Myxococcota bacterium]|nr:hypothetical protein [Myxococcota bacterium]
VPPEPLAEPSHPTVAFEPGSALNPELRLQAAVEELVAAATRPEARLTPRAVRLALARAGVAANSSLFLDRDGAPLWSRVPADVTGVATAERDFEGGNRLRVVAWTQSRRSLAELPLLLEPDHRLWMRVGGQGSLRLLVAGPWQEEGDFLDPGPVTERRIEAGNQELVSDFAAPGEYRLELVDGERVELLWSVFVGMPVPPPVPLPGPVVRGSPEEAEDWTFAALDRLRGRYGLPPLRRWTLLEPLLKEQAGCLLDAGVVAHTAPGCPSMGERSTKAFYPRPRIHEDLATGDTPAEAWEQLMSSPGHVQNLLCRTCTAVALAAVRAPQGHQLLLMDLLEFPEGEPRKVREAAP